MEIKVCENSVSTPVVTVVLFTEGSVSSPAASSCLFIWVGSVNVGKFSADHCTLSIFLF